MSDKKYTVLSYIIDNYEDVHPVEVKSDRARYIMVTNDKNLKDDSGTWEIVYDETLSGSTFDKCYQIRFNPFKYTDDEIIVRVDGSIGIAENLDVIVDKFIEDDTEMCLMVHPLRNTIFDEYKTWVDTRDFSPQQAGRVLNFMRFTESYDVEKYRGLVQFGFAIQRNNEVNRNANRLAYSFLKYLGTPETGIERLDQTTFSFVLNKYFNKMPITWVSDTLFGDRFLHLHHHKSFEIRDKIPEDYLIEPYFFNVKIPTVYNEQYFIDLMDNKQA